MGKNAGWQPKAKTDEDGKVMKTKDGKTIWETDKDGNVVMEYKKPEGVKGSIQQFLNKRVQKDVFSQKRLKRMQDFEKNREELMGSYISANPSHGFFMNEMERKGVMEAKDKDGNVITKLNKETGEQEVQYLQTDIARFELGLKEMNKARSEAKTKEHSAYGRKAAGMSDRFQLKKEDGGLLNTLFLNIKYNEDQKPITLQTAEHEMRTERAEAALLEGKAQRRGEYARGAGEHMEWKGRGESTEAIKKRTEYKGEEEEVQADAIRLFALANLMFCWQ